MDKSKWLWSWTASKYFDDSYAEICGLILLFIGYLIHNRAGCLERSPGGKRSFLRRRTWCKDCCLTALQQAQSTAASHGSLAFKQDVLNSNLFVWENWLQHRKRSQMNASGLLPINMSGAVRYEPNNHLNLSSQPINLECSTCCPAFIPLLARNHCMKPSH